MLLCEMKPIASLLALLRYRQTSRKCNLVRKINDDELLIRDSESERRKGMAHKESVRLEGRGFQKRPSIKMLLVADNLLKVKVSCSYTKFKIR